MRKMLDTVKDIPEVLKYLPDGANGKRIIDRDYLYSIIATLKTDWLKEQIDHAHTQRHKAPVDEEEKTIFIN